MSTRNEDQRNSNGASLHGATISRHWLNTPDHAASGNGTGAQSTELCSSSSPEQVTPNSLLHKNLGVRCSRASVAGYRATLLAIAATSQSGNGGLQRVRFSSWRAASIDALVIPRRRIEPARAVKEALRCPSGMLPSIGEVASLIAPLPWEEISSNSSTGSLGKAPLIGLSHM